ncbi:MAG: DinB family protein [Tepidiformaceae bacterium]
MPTTRMLAFSLVANTPDVLEAMLAGLPAEALEGPADGGWAPKDIVAHLLDVQEIAFVTRIRRIIEEENPLILPIEPGERLELGGYGSKTLLELLAEFREQRARDIAWMKGLPEAALARSGTHHEAGRVTGENFVHYWAVHDQNHIGQLARMLKAPIEGGIGNMQMFNETSELL